MLVESNEDKSFAMVLNWPALLKHCFVVALCAIAFVFVR